MFNEQRRLIWYRIFYETKDEPGVRKWTYVRAESPREARNVAEIRLRERYVEIPSIIEVKAI